MRAAFWPQRVNIPLALSPKTARDSGFQSRCPDPGRRPRKTLNEHLSRRPLAEEGGRARGGSVGSRAEDRHEIAFLRTRQLSLVGEAVERSAEAADDRGLLRRRRVESRRDRRRVIAPDHGAEVARGGKLVVQPAVGDEENLPMAFLAVDDPRQVHASFPDEVSAQLYRDRGAGQLARQTCEPLLERSADG